MTAASDSPWSPTRPVDVLAAAAVNPYVIGLTMLSLLGLALAGRSAFAVVATGAFMTGWASAWSP